MGTATTIGAPEGIIIHSREEKAQWTRTTAANTKVHHTVPGVTTTHTESIIATKRV